MSTTCLLLCVFLAAPADVRRNTHESEPDAAAREPMAQQDSYEIIRFGAAYCAPRVLYFMARYSGVQTTLEDVVRLCQTDQAGYTTLLHLCNAAEHLGLEPVAIDCTADELLKCSGPAVICIAISPTQVDKDANDGRSRVHFIGLIRREGDKCRIIDPSTGLDPVWVRGDALGRVFSGQVLLLKGCSMPSSSITARVAALALTTFAGGLVVLACSFAPASSTSVGTRRDNDSSAKPLV